MSLRTIYSVSLRAFETTNKYTIYLLILLTVSQLSLTPNGRNSKFAKVENNREVIINPKGTRMVKIGGRLRRITINDDHVKRLC